MLCSAQRLSLRSMLGSGTVGTRGAIWVETGVPVKWGRLSVTCLLGLQILPKLHYSCSSVCLHLVLIVSSLCKQAHFPCKIAYAVPEGSYLYCS